MTHEILKTDRIEQQTVKLIAKDRHFCVLFDSSPGPIHFPALCARWTFKTEDVARLAFSFMVAMHRCWLAVTRQEPAAPLLEAMERASAKLNAGMAQFNDYPPESRDPTQS